MNGFDSSESTLPDENLLRAARRAYCRVGLGVAAWMLVPEGVALLLQLITRTLAPGLFAAPWYVWAVQIFSSYVVGVPVALLIFGTPETETAPTRTPKKMTFLGFFFFFCIARALSLVGSQIGNLLMNVAGFLRGAGYDNSLSTLLNQSGLLPILLVVVIIGPIFEEIVFRYGAMRLLLPYGEVAAVFFSALAFGLAHGNFFQFFYAFLVGCLFGYVYLRTGRLADSILLHIFFNFTGSFLPIFLLRAANLDALGDAATANDLIALVLQNPLPFLFLLLFGLLSFAASVAGVIFLLTCFRRAKFAPSPLGREDVRRAAFPNVGTVLLLLVSLLLFALSFITT